MPHAEKGTAAAETWRKNMAEGKRRAHEKRVDAARAVLGERPVEELEQYVKDEQKRARDAKKATTDAKKAAKRAAEATRAAVSAQDPKPEEVVVSGAGAYNPGLEEARDSLALDPVFGDQGGMAGASMVHLYRLPSPSRLHQGEGVSEGYLEEIPYLAFSQAFVQARHGGGKYRAVVMDSLRRVLREASFPVSGRAKAFDLDGGTEEEPEEDNSVQQWPQQPYAFPYGGPPGAPTGAAPGYHPYYQPPPRQDSEPKWLSQLLPALVKPTEDPEILRQREQERHDQRMRELQATWAREREQEERRRQDEQRRQELSQSSQMQMFATLLSAQGQAQAEATKQSAAMMTTLMSALIANKSDDSPAVKTMSTVMESMTGLTTKMLETVSAAASGEDSRSLAERLIDTAGSIVVPVLNKIVGDTKIETTPKWTQPEPTPEPEPEPTGVTLPDGRFLPHDEAGSIVKAYVQQAGRNPDSVTESEVYEILTHHLDQQAAAQPVAAIPQNTGAGAAPGESVSAPTHQTAPVPSSPQPWMAKGGLAYVLQSFQRGVTPDVCLRDMIDSRQISLEACRDIGGVWHGAGSKGSLVSILMGVFDRLKVYDIEAPANFLLVFQGSETGDKWLDEFLSCCHVVATSAIQEMTVVDGPHGPSKSKTNPTAPNPQQPQQVAGGAPGVATLTDGHPAATAMTAVPTVTAGGAT